MSKWKKSHQSIKYPFFCRLPNVSAPNCAPVFFEILIRLVSGRKTIWKTAHYLGHMLSINLFLWEERKLLPSLYTFLISAIMFLSLDVSILSIHILSTLKADLSQDLSGCSRSKAISKGSEGALQRPWAQCGIFLYAFTEKTLLALSFWSHRRRCEFLKCS